MSSNPNVAILVNYHEIPPCSSKPHILDPGETLNTNIKSNYKNPILSHFSKLPYLLQGQSISLSEQESTNSSFYAARPQVSSDLFNIQTQL
jgi:hypothetical protein